MKSQCDVLETAIKQQVSAIQWIEQYEPSGNLPLKELLAQLEAQLSEERASEQTDRILLEQVESRLSKSSERLGKAEALEKVKMNLSGTQEKLEVSLKQEEELQVVYQQEVKRQPQRERLREEITLQRNSLQRYEELDTVQKAWEQKMLLCQKQERLYETSRIQLEMQEKTLLDKRTALMSYGDCAANLERLERRKAELLTEEKVLQRVQETAILCEELEKNLLQKQRHYQKLRAVAEDGEQRYERFNRMFLDAQAGILAMTLEPGEPCPVCGSCSHPALAAYPEAAPSEAELEETKRQCERDRRKAAEASEACGSVRALLADKEAQLAQQLEELRLENTERALENLCNKKQTRIELEEAIQQEQQSLQQKRALEILLPKLESACKTQKEIFERSERELEEKRTELLQAQYRVERLSQELQFPSKKDAEAHIAELVAMHTELQDAYTSSENACQNIRVEIIALERQICQLKDQLADAPQISVKEEREKQAELTQKKLRLTRELTALSGRISGNEGVRLQILRQIEKQKNLESRYQWLKSLSDTANGTLTGREKIMLETYIQMTYFDQTIGRANSRLLQMTGGQYELKRRTAAGDFRSQSGLELDVVDHYNGSTRSVRTLSGGESFLASLCLALGMADEIQSSAGGIQMDCLFIDEGFGSLDEEALQQSMAALGGLAEGKRLVGVISHVSELKERIDKQILVTKEKTGGSRVKLLI